MNSIAIGMPVLAVVAFVLAVFIGKKIKVGPAVFCLICGIFLAAGRIGDIATNLVTQLVTTVAAWLAGLAG